MTDIWIEDNENSDESCDKQDIESYLYSLVHHVPINQETSQEPAEDHPFEEEDSAPKRNWRYFNATATQGSGDSFSKRLEQLSEQYNCRNLKRKVLKLKKNRLWRNPLAHREVYPLKISRVEDLQNKLTGMKSINVDHLTDSNNTNVSIPEICEVVQTVACENIDNQEKHCTLLSIENTTSTIAVESITNEDSSRQVNCTQDVVKEISDSGKIPASSKEIEDHNNTVPSQSSSNDCFELPLNPKAKLTVNESMTQALQVMLDEDASRSSIDSSDKRPTPKSKGPSKPGNGCGWTVGMSWEDMSSKFRFNFEVDSVCGDSVREGSISASSRANTPEVPLSPEDVSKYDISLKNTENTAVEVATVEDNSDSEVESVVEVLKPDLEPPLLVEISSDNEDFIPPKVQKMQKIQLDIEEDIVILYEAGTTPSNRSGNSNSSAIHLNPAATRVPEVTIGTGKKKDRQKKKAKPMKDPIIVPRKDSELENVLSGMSDDPNLWRLCREDIYPRPAGRKFGPCDNCKQRDHLTWHCPEPVKIKVCSLCSKPGHKQMRCPQRMCLNCGLPAPAFVKRCQVCRNKLCDICSWTGHKTQQCPDLWRRYHFTTNKGPPVVPPPDVKVRSHAEMWCCNCAKKGHFSESCPMPSSTINEKILSSVVSYGDPADERGRPITKTFLVSTYKTSSSRTCPTPIATTSPKPAHEPKPLKTRIRKLELIDVSNTPEFKKNYKRFLPKLHSLCSFPVQPGALANYLEWKLELIKKPVLQGRDVQSCYTKLMNLMGKDKFTKPMFRRASMHAAQLNMTLLGYAGLAHGNVLVDELRNQVEKLRRLNAFKVPVEIRRIINAQFTQIFKGTIRKDLKSLVGEYLKREGIVSD